MHMGSVCFNALSFISVHGTDLKVENFCFLKEPLAIDDPVKNIIREASVRKSSVVGVLQTFEVSVIGFCLLLIIFISFFVTARINTTQT